MPALPATSASQLERSAITGAASSAARVRLAEITWAERVELGPGPLGIAHQVLVQHDAEVTRALAHLLERAAAAAEQVDQRHAFGIEQLEGKPHPLGRILDAGEGVGDVGEQVLAAAQVAALVAQRDAHLRQRVLSLAGALRRLGRPPGEALQRHVERLLLDAGRLGGEPQLLQRLDADPDLVRGLADRIRRRDRAVDQRGETADRGGADERATERADAGAQQLRLAAEALQPARGALARALDALQALLAALADRDQLGLDLAAALDRQADGVGLGASGHGSACVSDPALARAGRLYDSRGQLPRPVGRVRTSHERLCRWSTIFWCCRGSGIRLNGWGKQLNRFRKPFQRPEVGGLEHQIGTGTRIPDLTRQRIEVCLRRYRRSAPAICTAEPKRSSPSATGSPTCMPIITRMGVSLIFVVGREFLLT